MNSIEHNTGEIVMYQPDETIRLEVRFANENAWLNRQQMAELFDRDVKTIGKHIGNALQEELRKVPTVAKFAIVQKEGNRMVNRTVEFYSLDMVISVGYRVKSEKGIEFRIWANQVLKEYLLRGYSINYKMRQLEQKMDNQQVEIQNIKNTLNAHQEKIDFFVRTNQPPVEGVLFEGQIFDAYKLVEVLEKREQDVDATIYTEHVGQSLQHLQQLNHQQYGRRIEVKEYNNRFHDRFLILDDALYHFGASFKDLGKRLFAFELMGIDKNIILNQL